LTQAACEHIEQMFSQQRDKTVFRLSVKTTGCNGYMYVPALLEAPLESDRQVALDAPFSVYVAQEALAIIQGTVIDFEEKSLGMKQLTFRNPNAAGTCGCGESFNLKEGGDDG